MPLRRVYIQDPNAENISERFAAIKQGPMLAPPILITDTYQFTLPNEL